MQEYDTYYLLSHIKLIQFAYLNRMQGLKKRLKEYYRD